MEASHPHSGSSFTWFLVELEFGNVCFQGEGKTRVPGEKPFTAKERTCNNKLNPHGIDARIWTQATLVEGECSHHCATLAPMFPCSIRNPVSGLKLTPFQRQTEEKYTSLPEIKVTNNPIPESVRQKTCPVEQHIVMCLHSPYMGVPPTSSCSHPLHSKQIIKWKTLCKLWTSEDRSPI